MIEKYWGLKLKPFLNTPDLKFLYPSSEYTESFARLIYNIKEIKGGIALIIGEIGTGKTMLLRSIASTLEKDKFKIATIINPVLTPNQFLCNAIQSFGEENPARSKFRILRQLEKILYAGKNEGLTLTLLIDEAQLLCRRVLEEIRLLSNYETEDSKLLQIILFGQPELDKKIKDFKAFLQRIAIRYHLGPLSQKETEEYINHRLKIAKGVKRQIFDKRSIREIYRFSKGIPRLINHICQNALFVGYSQNVKLITKDIICDVVNELMVESDAKD